MNDAQIEDIMESSGISFGKKPGRVETEIDAACIFGADAVVNKRGLQLLWALGLDGTVQECNRLREVCLSALRSELEAFAKQSKGSAK